MKKRLILVRGLPGSGKSEFAREMADLVSPGQHVFQVCADDCWSYDYVKDPRGFTMDGLAAAHKECLKRTHDALDAGIERVIVHNTFTSNWELEPYMELGKEHGYRVVTLIVENRHGSASIHNVPKDTIEKMKGRFSVCL